MSAAVTTGPDGLVHYIPAPKTACGVQVGTRGPLISQVTCPDCLKIIKAIQAHLATEPR